MMKTGEVGRPARANASEFAGPEISAFRDSQDVLGVPRTGREVQGVKGRVGDEPNWVVCCTGAAGGVKTCTRNESSPRTSIS